MKICFKIWSVANGMVFLLFAVALSGKGMGLPFTALLFSCLFSLPAMAILYFLFCFLRRARGPALFSWIVLLLGTALTAFACYCLFNICYKEVATEMAFILPLSFISGYCAVLLFSPSIHTLFQTFRYENNESY